MVECDGRGKEMNGTRKVNMEWVATLGLVVASHRHNCSDAGLHLIKAIILAGGGTGEKSDPGRSRQQD